MKAPGRPQAGALVTSHTISGGVAGGRVGWGRVEGGKGRKDVEAIMHGMRRAG